MIGVNSFFELWNLRPAAASYAQIRSKWSYPVRDKYPNFTIRRQSSILLWWIQKWSYTCTMRSWIIYLNVSNLFPVLFLTPLVVQGTCFFDIAKRLISIDLSPRMIEASASRLNHPVTLHYGDMRDLSNLDHDSTAAVISFFCNPSSGFQSHFDCTCRMVPRTQVLRTVAAGNLGRKGDYRPWREFRHHCISIL